VHNKIVTASHDRNAFVFTYNAEEDKWVAGLVLLRLPRGCTGAVWSPDGMCDGADAVCRACGALSCMCRNRRVCLYRCLCLCPCTTLH